MAAYRFGDLRNPRWQQMVIQMERELEEYLRLQNPPAPKDAATQTLPLEDTIFSRSNNPADLSIQCNWVIEHSLTIEFEGNYNWLSMYEDTGILQTGMIGNAICRFAKKGIKARNFLLETFGNSLTVTRGLHMSCNDFANPHGFPHFNAIDCDGKSVHVYCKPGINHRCVHIVSFSKIQVANFSAY